MAIMNRAFPAEQPPMSEPFSNPDVAVDGLEIDAGPHTVHFTGWVTSVTGRDIERRVVARFTMPVDAAQWFAMALADILKVDPLQRSKIARAECRDVAMDN
jgi:hypothetical protein